MWNACITTTNDQWRSINIHHSISRVNRQNENTKIRRPNFMMCFHMIKLIDCNKNIQRRCDGNGIVKIIITMFAAHSFTRHLVNAFSRKIMYKYTDKTEKPKMSQHMYICLVTNAHNQNEIIIRRRGKKCTQIVRSNATMDNTFKNTSFFIFINEEIHNNTRR